MKAVNADGTLQRRTTAEENVALPEGLQTNAKDQQKRADLAEEYAAEQRARVDAEVGACSLHQYVNHCRTKRCMPGSALLFPLILPSPS